jgi:type IV pilus assembly protein PilY1
MIFTKARISCLGLGAFWALASGMPAAADDTELFIGNNLSSQAQPNILFVLDNSGSMGTVVRTQETYDSAIVYPSAGCDANRVYWRTGIGDPPGCGTSRWFNATALRCERAKLAFQTAGFFTDNMAQYDPTNGGNGRRWENFSSSEKDRVVECQDDRGLHGDGVNTTNLYARSGQSGVAGYWGLAGTEISWGQTPANETYTIYSGNYLNWIYGPTAFKTRLEIVQEVATDLLDSINGVNVGLATFNPNGFGGDNGGYIVHELADIATARAPIQAAVNGLTPTGFTPLSETLYEMTNYYSGRRVDYGTSSVPASRLPGDPTRYLSPIGQDCQKNFIVYLTDGEPTLDDAADANIRAMTDHGGDSFSSLVGATCDAEVYPAGFNPSGGQCLDDLAELLYEGDWSPLPGQQNVTTYTVGFTLDLPVLADTAQRGGGRYYTADDTATLANALTSIVTAILTQDTTFTAPTVAVNSFNRTQNLSDLFISVFRPSGRMHWPGNLKKYRIRATDATIVDANGQPAIDPSTGFFADTSQSYWSSAADGPVADVGGAADIIPLPANRHVYTHFGASNTLTAPSNRVATTNAGLTDAVLNTGAPGDPTRDEVIDFMNNLDVPDTDQDNLTTDVRSQIGDPLHSQPVSVIYGPGLRDGLVFMATNDGYLHAIDLESGIEQWAFVPPEFLGKQIDLYKDESSAYKQYAIDGDLRVQMVADNDGIIEAGEKVYLFFGMGRGGDFYYGLDVTDPLAPQLLWRRDGATLPGLGQTWSSPMPTRMNIAGAAQNADKLVLVMGGGYEPDQDNNLLTTDIVGNSIYVVDSVSGNLLWHGSRDGVHKDFNVAGRAMDYSIPSRIRVVDIDGDGFADRLYAGDMGGQVWRFDVFNGQAAASLITGGVIARLGGAPNAVPALADTRRFYNTPDVAFINTPEGNFIHVGIGSGHRGHPLSTSVQDRFYALRDYLTAAQTQAQFDARTLITDAALVPVTTVNPTVAWGGPGWRIDLNIGGWNGEKVLSEARTFANQVFFSTFQPSTAVATCEPQLGTNRTYAMSVYNGSPVMNLDSSADPSTLTMSDLYVQAEGGILSAAQALFVANDGNGDGIPDTEQDTDGDGIPDSEDPDANGNGVADALEDADGDGILNYLDPDWGGNSGDDVVVCVALRCFAGVMTNDPIRTFWSQESVD